MQFHLLLFIFLGFISLQLFLSVYKVQLGYAQIHSFIYILETS